MSAEYLLPPDWMVRLERMSLGSAKRVAGTLQGKRRSSRLGSSLEFADYRPYAPGDDIRRFDWGVYARTGKPFVRQFMDEQELMVSLYVDCSASMDFAGGTRAGSERTLAAGLTHASRTPRKGSGRRVSNAWEHTLSCGIAPGNWN